MSEDKNIIRVRKDARYFVASNIPFNDERLSWEARGIMGYLLSKPDDWQVRMTDLQKQGPAGLRIIKRVLAELRQAGYMSRETKRTAEGKFIWITTLYESPELNKKTIYTKTIDGSPIDGKCIDIGTTESLNTNSRNEKIIQQSNAKVDAIIEVDRQSKSRSWTKIPEPFQPLCQAFCEVTTLEYSKRAAMDWMSTFSDWMEAGYSPEMVRDAVKAICQQPNPPAISRPGSIEWKLRDLKVKKAQAAMGNIPAEQSKPVFNKINNRPLPSGF